MDKFNDIRFYLSLMLGIQLLLEVIGAVEGRSREQCVEILKVCYPNV